MKELLIQVSSKDELLNKGNGVYYINKDFEYDKLRLCEGDIIQYDERFIWVNNINFTYLHHYYINIESSDIKQYMSEETQFEIEEIEGTESTTQLIGHYLLYKNKIYQVPDAASEWDKFDIKDTVFHDGMEVSKLYRVYNHKFSKLMVFISPVGYNFIFDTWNVSIDAPISIGLSVSKMNSSLGESYIGFDYSEVFTIVPYFQIYNIVLTNRIHVKENSVELQLGMEYIVFVSGIGEMHLQKDSLITYKKDGFYFKYYNKENWSTVEAKINNFLPA